MDNFSKELDKYLDERQTTRPTDFLIKKKLESKTPDEKVPEMSDGEVIIEERDMTFFEKILGKFKREKKFDDVDEIIDEAIMDTEDVGVLEEEYEELDEAEHALEDKKMSILQKIMHKLRRATIEEETVIVGDEHETLYDEGTFVVPQDLKEAMRIQNEWLRRLPHTQLQAFKNSEDYKRYQQILQDYGLIK